MFCTTGNHSVSLVTAGRLSVNNSHVVVKRAAVGSETEQKAEPLGVYAAPGHSDINTTHLVKNDPMTSKVTAIMSIPSQVRAISTVYCTCILGSCALF